MAQSISAERRPSQRFGTVVAGEDNRTRVIFRRSLSHPVDKAWTAIAEPTERAVWVPGIRFDPGRNARFDIWFGDACEGPSHVSGKLDPFEPPTRLGLGSMRFELEAAPQGCLLTFSDVLWFDGKRSNVDFANAVLAGWHRFLDTLEIWLDEGVSALDLEEPDYSVVDVPGRDALLDFDNETRPSIKD